jgi:hypothetical protein
MLKKLLEQRAELQDSMKVLLESAQKEERAMTTEENAKFDEVEQNIKNCSIEMK